MDCQVEEYLWHPNFPDWLYGRLEEMGFDGSVYSHYIMSVLNQPAGLNEALASNQKATSPVAADCCPPKATLFECLMSSDMEKDIVKIFVDDIVGKYIQWCRYVENDKRRGKSLGKDNCRLSLSLDNEEAFPPLYRGGSTMLRRFVVQETDKEVPRPCSRQLNRENDTTPKKRIKLEENGNLCAAEAVLCEQGSDWRDSCLNLEHDDVGDLLDEISRVALAFNNVLPNNSCSRSDPVIYDTSIWNGMLDLCVHSNNVSDNIWACWNQPDSSDALNGQVDNGFGVIADHHNTYLAENLGCLPSREHSNGLHFPLSTQSAFSASAIADGRQMLAGWTGYAESSELPEDLHWLQQRRWMLQIRRRIPDGPVDIPISDETHFIPIRSESMQSAYLPYTALEKQFENYYGSCMQATTADDAYFVYHEVTDDDDEDCVNKIIDNRELGKKSLTLRFRAVKLDKFCQTDWCPSHKLPTDHHPHHPKAANLSVADCLPSTVVLFRKSETDHHHYQRQQQPHGQCRNVDDELDEVASGNAWQYQDEKDDEMLIRYVSSISLINPLELNSSSLSNGAYS